MRVRELPNGLTTVAVHRPGAGTGLVSVDVRVGARYESPADAGLSHFLEHMVFQGCPGFPTPEAVNDAAERMGAAFDACTTRDATQFSHWMDPERIDESASLLCALLREPLFAAIESERAIILEEALDELDEDGRVVDADTLTRRALWPKSPLGQSVIGERARLERFAVPDLRRHHQRYYGARNMIATAVGPQPADALLDVLARHFGTLPPGERHAPEGPGPLPGEPELIFVDDSRSQCDCRLVFRTPGYSDEEAPALTLLRLALDDGLASRLHRRLGNELGLAYDQWASWDRYADTGAFEIGAHVSAGKVRLFFEEAYGLLRRLVSEPPEGDELARVRFRARWSTRCALDSAEGLAAVYGSRRLYQDDPPTPEERIARFDRVGPAELSAVARRILDPAGHVACCVGPLPKADRRAIRSLVKRFRVE